jgi:ribosome recycling factor
MANATKQKVIGRMDAAIEHVKRELAGLRTGRASLALLDTIKVDYYGTPTPLKQVANLAVPESRLMTVQPWEPQLIKEIEKAILASGLGLTPSNDGKIIRIPVPQLTEERRKDLIKVCKKHAEETKVSLRTIRREGNEELKHLQKDAKLSEDDLRKAENEIQKLTDQYVEKVDQILKKKEEEILEV